MCTPATHEMYNTIRGDTLYIYTDGSSLMRPRRGGIGVCFVWLDKDGSEKMQSPDLTGYEQATNNQMELLACIEGLQLLSILPQELTYSLIEIRTDSQYVANHKDTAVYNWQHQNWCTREGRPVENDDLWRKLIKWLNKVKCNVRFHWTKGHSTDQYNREADRKAKQSAKGILKPPIKMVTPRRKTTTESVRIGSVKMLGQKISIRIDTSYAPRRDGLVKYRYEVISVKSPFKGKVDFGHFT